MRNTRDLENELAELVNYHQQLEKLEEHDPLKLVVAGFVNEKMLHEVADESQALAEKKGGKALSAEQLRKMQDYAFKFKKRHPLATEERVTAAVAGYFGLTICPPDESK